MLPSYSRRLVNFVLSLCWATMIKNSMKLFRSSFWGFSFNFLLCSRGFSFSFILFWKSLGFPVDGFSHYPLSQWSYTMLPLLPFIKLLSREKKCFFESLPNKLKVFCNICSCNAFSENIFFISGFLDNHLYLSNVFP